MDIIPLLRAFAADNLPSLEKPWHGTTHRISGLGRDALEITPFADLINIEAIAWRDGCEAMLTLEQAEEAHVALGLAIAEARRHAAPKVIPIRKVVPAAPGAARGAVEVV